MIRRVFLLTFDSFGVRSIATFVETDDLRILVNLGVSLMPSGYGLEPDALEWERFDETWKIMK